MQKTNKEYWDGIWTAREKSPAAYQHQTGLANYINRQFHEYFSRIFGNTKTKGLKLLEIGCASSHWLPYFAKEFGFEVSGIDYSEIGCQQASEILSKERIQGRIVCTDFFNPPASMIEAFDVVVSFGVAEHFQDTAACISAFSRFLKHGGLILTSIPNLSGLIGYIQKLINRPVFNMHVILDTTALKDAHEKAALNVLDCNYFVFTNFNVCNLQGLPTRSISWLLKKFLPN